MEEVKFRIIFKIPLFFYKNKKHKPIKLNIKPFFYFSDEYNKTDQLFVDEIQKHEYINIAINKKGKYKIYQTDIILSKVDKKYEHIHVGLILENYKDLGVNNLTNAVVENKYASFEIISGMVTEKGNKNEMDDLNILIPPDYLQGGNTNMENQEELENKTKKRKTNVAIVKSGIIIQTNFHENECLMKINDKKCWYYTFAPDITLINKNIYFSREELIQYLLKTFQFL